jgi:hypothetical protein
MDNSAKQIKENAETRVLVFIHARRRRRGSRICPSCQESKQHIMVIRNMKSNTALN